jgi:hypothetical protein
MQYPKRLPMSQRLEEKVGSELITDIHRSSENSTLGPFFILCRLILITIVLILGVFGCSSGTAFLITLPLNFLDFYITKTLFGPNLVGLKWYFDRSESPIFPFLVFYSQPSPFVASTRNSNLFWIGLLVSVVIEAVLILFFLMAGKITFVLISIIMFILTAGNISGFIKCHNIAKITEEKAARSLLLDQNVTFQAANEGNPSDLESEEEEIGGNRGKRIEQNEKELSDEIE